MTELHMQQMTQRVGAVLSEYVDQFILLAVPTDDPSHGITIADLSESRIDREDLEDQVIALAAEIMNRRRSRTGG